MTMKFKNRNLSKNDRKEERVGQKAAMLLELLGISLGLSACSLSGVNTPQESSIAVVEESTMVAVEESTGAGESERTEATTETTTEEETLTDYEVTIGEEGKSVSIHSHDYVANISGIPITDLKAFKKELKQLPNLLYLDMCDCGLTNEQMEELQTEFPGIKFAWRVHMGTWSLRTDALAFSTLHAYANDVRLTNDQAQVLKYCTDLVSLDIGHNDVYDIGFIENMPNLHMLIMVDNFNTDQGGRFNDLSVLKNCPNMMYLEFFVSGVSDLSFLEYNKEMVDLNISYSPVSDSTYLFDLPKIERLYLECTSIPYSDFEKLQETYPDAHLVYYGSGSVDQGWRTHPRYYAMIDMYHKDYWNDLFRTEEELEDVATYDMLIVNGTRYYGTAFVEEDVEDLVIAGSITSTVGKNHIPTEEGECNFSGVGRDYTVDCGDGDILVKMLDGKYHHFYKNEVIARLLREKLGE